MSFEFYKSRESIVIEKEIEPPIESKNERIISQIQVT